MKRKINLVGTNTLTVSLPSKWAKDNDIKKGDELELNTEGKNIILSLDDVKKGKKEIVVDVDKYDYLLLSKIISILYKFNYRKIILEYSNQESYHFKKKKTLNTKTVIKSVINRLIGAEIIAQSAKRTEIECLIDENPDLDKIERRIHYLLKETFNELINSIDKDFQEFHDTIEDHHDAITKFINYYLRGLYASDKPDDEKNIANSFYSNLDYLVDQIRRLSAIISKVGCTKKAKDILINIFENLDLGFRVLNNKRLFNEFLEDRYKIVETINKTKFESNELQVIREAQLFINQVGIFTEYALIKDLSRD